MTKSVDPKQHPFGTLADDGDKLKFLGDELGELGVSFGEWGADHSFGHPIAEDALQVSNGIMLLYRYLRYAIERYERQ